MGNLNQRQAWRFLFLAFLSSVSFPGVQGWCPSNLRLQESSFGSSLIPFIGRSANPYGCLRKQRTMAAFQLFSAASTPDVNNLEGNQTISFNNNNNPSANGGISDVAKGQKVVTGGDGDDDGGGGGASSSSPKKGGYDLGLGKNKPVKGHQEEIEHLGEDVDEKLHWYAPEPIRKPVMKTTTYATTRNPEPAPSPLLKDGNLRRTRKMVARREEDQILRGALWHEEHFDNNPKGDHPSSNQPAPAEMTVTKDDSSSSNNNNRASEDDDFAGPRRPAFFYPDIDLSIPESIYSNSTDVVWDLMRWEAYQEAQREPLLVSFLYSSILNHDSLESSLAFLLANKISSPAMISTQIQSLVKEALALDPSVGRAIRADMMAVRDRDPACTCLPDVFLYFKGFQALQTYRVANILWTKKSKTVLSHYLQSQMSQTFQIDIHPNATLGSGIMLDHGTGIVIGETARVGHNCSILHHVTLGGSGKKGVDRHPKIGEGVLLGAGASVIGSVNIGDGCQIGAGTLVISDLPAHSVAVGVPAKIIGSFVDVTEQPSNVMNQMMDKGFNPFHSEGI